MPIFSLFFSAQNSSSVELRRWLSSFLLQGARKLQRSCTHKIRVWWVSSPSCDKIKVTRNSSITCSLLAVLEFRSRLKIAKTVGKKENFSMKHKIWNFESGGNWQLKKVSFTEFQKVLLSINTVVSSSMTFAQPTFYIQVLNSMLCRDHFL